MAFLGQSLQASDVSPAARDRARVYQEEAKNVLSHHGWHIALNQTGRIIADHPLGVVANLGGGNQKMGLTDTDPEGLKMLDFYEYARLMLTFVPASGTRTDCTANIVAYHYDRTYGGKFSKPFPFDNPESAKKLRGMLAEAEKSMAAKHPEYTAR